MVNKRAKEIHYTHYSGILICYTCSLTHYSCLLTHHSCLQIRHSCLQIRHSRAGGNPQGTDNE